MSFAFRFQLLRLSLSWRRDGPLYLACSAGVFFGRAMLTLPPLSFFRPRTYPKGYYFYSPQSSSVTKSKMAAATIRLAHPKIENVNTPALQATLYFERLAKKWYSQTGSLITVLEVNLDTKTGEAHSFPNLMKHSKRNVKHPTRLFP